MKQLTYLTLTLGLLLFSCTNKEQAWENEKEDFISACEKSALKSSKAAMGPDVLAQISEERLVKLLNSQCQCQFEFLKEKYESPDEALEKGIDAVVKEIEGCEASDEEIEALFN